MEPKRILCIEPFFCPTVLSFYLDLPVIDSFLFLFHKTSSFPCNCYSVGCNIVYQLQYIVSMFSIDRVSCTLRYLLGVKIYVVAYKIRDWWTYIYFVSYVFGYFLWALCNECDGYKCEENSKCRVDSTDISVECVSAGKTVYLYVRHVMCIRRPAISARVQKLTWPTTRPEPKQYLLVKNTENCVNDAPPRCRWPIHPQHDGNLHFK